MRKPNPVAMIAIEQASKTYFKTFIALSPILKTLCILINGQFQKTGQIRGDIGQGVHKITTRRPFSLL